MSFEETLWIGCGIAMIFLELFLPGLVSVFLGFAAILVGILIYLGWISGIVQTFGAWMGLSVILILTIRQIAARFWLSDAEYKYTEEDADAAGKIVEVSQTVNSSNTDGRIRFQGTDWPARSVNETIKKGSHAVIKYRDNIAWVIDKPDKLDKPPKKTFTVLWTKWRFGWIEKPNYPSKKEN